MSYSIFDARFPTGHGGHGTRHTLAMIVSGTFPAMIRHAGMPLVLPSVTRSCDLKHHAIERIPSPDRERSVLAQSRRAQKLSCLEGPADIGEWKIDEEKLTPSELAWLAFGIAFVLVLCRMVNLAMS